MSMKFLLPRPCSTLSIVAVMVAALGLTACGNVEQTPVFNDNDKRAEFSNVYSQNIYNALVAEMYSYYGELELSADYYARIINNQESLEVAKRLTRLSVEHNNDESALNAVDLWIEQEPESVDARQLRAMLHIRENQYKEAAKDLFWLQQSIDKKTAVHDGEYAGQLQGAGTRYVATILGLEVEKEKAFNAFKEYIKLTDKVTEASLALSAFALNANRYDEAEIALKDVLKSDNARDKERATLLYVKALVAQEKHQQALEVLKPLFETSDNRDLRLEYARLLIMNDQSKAALQAFKQLSKSYPEDSDVLYTLGLLHLEQKQFSEAIPVLKTLSDLPERRGEAYYFLGEAYEGLDDFDSAMEAYNESISLGFYKEAQARIVSIMMENQGVDAALDYLSSLRASLNNDDERFESYMMQGSLYYESKSYDKALEAYKEAAKLKQNSIDVWYAESLVYSAIRDIDKVEEVLNNILEKDPGNASALNALGYTLALYTDRFKEAKSYIEKALEAKPNDPAITDSLGWVEYRMGNLEEAETLLRKAYNDLPDPEVAAHLVEVLVKRGKRPEAEAMLNDMLNKHPQDELLNGVREKMNLGRL